MVKIHKSQFDEFFRRSKSLKPSNQLPVLSFIKLEITDDGASLTKTNMNSWCLHQIVADGEPVVTLLDERVIQSMTGDIEITADDKKVYVSDGYLKLSFPKEDPAQFPVFPEVTGEKVTTELNKSVLKTIGAASQTLKNEVDNTLAYVHVKDGGIFSTDNFKVFGYDSGEQLPALLLDEECCRIISEYDSLLHFQAGNYDFFDTGKTLYGFIKCTFKTPDFNLFFKNLNGHVDFEIDLENIVWFCDRVNNVTPAKVPEITMKGDRKESRVYLSLNDPEFHKTADHEVEIEGMSNMPLQFNPRLMLPYLKSLPYKRVGFLAIPNSFNYYLVTKEDPKFKGIICGIAF